MQLPKPTLLGALAFLAAPFATAQTIYVDGGYASASTDFDIEIEDFEESFDLTFGLVGGHIGYDFNPYFSIEGEALIGVQDDTHTVTIEDVEDDVDVDFIFDLNHLVGAYARGNLPLGDQFRAFARAGYVTGEIELSTNLEGVESESDSGEAFALGVGGEFNLTEQIYARGDYTRYEFDDASLDAFMASVGFRF
ncbi:MAG: porin family protein [Pseudomonadota bacterium]